MKELHKTLTFVAVALVLTGAAVVPLPGEATLYLPGLAFNSATRSCIVWAGKSLLTSHEFGVPPILLIGMKSLPMSYGTVLYRLGFTTRLDEANSKV